MKITHQIAEPVVDVAHVDTYEVVVEYMHGDADAYTTNSFVFSTHQTDIETMERLFAAYSVLFNLASDGENIDSRVGIEQLVNSGMPKNDATRAIDNLYMGDVTREGHWAPPCDIQVFFYYENGLKHRVEVKVDGKELT